MSTNESKQEDEQEREEYWWENVLYDADENCDHNIQSASGGGVKCTKCRGWFCF